MMESIVMTETDVTYIRANYVSLPALVAHHEMTIEQARAHIAAGVLPGPAYVLPGGTEMFPRDLFELAEDAGGFAGARSEFERRFRAAAEQAGEPASEEASASAWTGYMTGLHGVCLRQVTPENIFRKDMLVRRLTEQLALPRPEDAAWRARLRADVDALDALERPFAPCDRIRFDGPVTRDRLISAPRLRYPECFSAAPDTGR